LKNRNSKILLNPSANQAQIVLKVPLYPSKIPSNPQPQIALRKLGDSPKGLARDNLIYFSPSPGNPLAINIPFSNRKLITPYDGDYEISVRLVIVYFEAETHHAG
jgi:hypothetical protein